MSLSDSDKIDTIARYSRQFAQFGYSPKALGWDKGKQEIRFGVLSNFFDLRNKKILDIGCGFGDLNRYLSGIYKEEYSYVGIDLVSDLIGVAEKINSGSNTRYITGDFLQYEFMESFDVIVASGIFNHKFQNSDNYSFIADVMAKAMTLAGDGVAFDFLSDKVDYCHDHTFHSAPEKVMAIGYALTRNLVLRNDYFPFEFSLCMYKDDGFDVSDTIFDRWKLCNETTA